MGGNALVKTIPVVVSILLRFGLAIEFSDAAAYFTAVSDGGPVAPVKAFAHSQEGEKAWSTRNSMVRAFKSQVWSPEGFPATLKALPGRSGWTMRAVTLEATVLNLAAGMMLPARQSGVRSWDQNRSRSEPESRRGPVVVVLGRRFLPCTTGRPRASVPATVVCNPEVS